MDSPKAPKAPQPSNPLAAEFGRKAEEAMEKLFGIANQVSSPTVTVSFDRNQRVVAKASAKIVVWIGNDTDPSYVW